MPISFFEASIFSKAAYDKTIILPDSWERASFFENESGLGISIFNSHREQKTVLAFRGTQNLQNLVSDAQILLQWPISVAEQAIQFYQQSQHLYYPDVTFTGHSLGGALASSMALEYGISTITFDSPGFYSHALAMPYFHRHEALIYSLVGQPNLVNTCHQHVGTLLFINTDMYHSSIGAGVDIIRDNSVLQTIAGNSASILKTIADATDTALSVYSTGYLHQMRHFIAFLEDSNRHIFRIRTWVNWVNHTQDIRQIPAIIRQYELHNDPIDIKTFSNHQNTSTTERRMTMLNQQQSSMSTPIDEAALTTMTSSATAITTPPISRAQSVGGRLAQFNLHFLREYARNHFLGHGFSRVHYSSLQPSSRFVLRSACEVTDTDIVVSEPASVQMQCIGYSENETVDQLSSSIDFAFLLPLRVNLGAQIKRENRQEQRDNSIELVYSFFRYESIHSRLAELPDRSLVEARGDSFVHSGRLHVGYEVHVKIKLQKKENEDISNLMGSINASFLGMGLKLGGERLQEHLDVSRVLHVSAHARSACEFRPEIANIRNISDALAAIERIEEDFCQFLPQLQQFSVFIDPDHDVVPYGQLLEPEIAHDLTEPNLQEAVVPKTLIDLGKQLHEELPESDRSIINEANINLSTLFETMHVTLGNTVRESQRFSEHGRIMAMGRTRLGKSVVMGHLLGHPLAMPEIQGALRVEYSDEFFTGRRPKIGHRHAAETKGIFVYTEHPDTDLLEAIDCIDCAGTLDTEHSVETDICNAMSTAVAVKRQAPTAILVVMPSTWITDTGMVDFLETLQRLKRILPSDHRVWSSVMFILNNHMPITHPVRRRSFLSADEIKENVLRQIQIKIVELRADLDRLRPARGIAAGLWNAVTRNMSAASEEVDWHTGFSEAELQASLDENRIIQINRITGEIRLLERLLQYQDNFIVTDFEAGKNIKEEVLRILQNRTRLSLTDLVNNFKPECFYEDRVANIKFKFETVLRCLVTYFNQFPSNDKKFDQELQAKQRLLDTTRQNLQEIAQIKRAVNEGNRDALRGANQIAIRGLLANLNSEEKARKVEERVKLVHSFVSKIFSEETFATRRTAEGEVIREYCWEKMGILGALNEILRLMNDESSMFLTDINTATVIEDRWQIAYFNWMAAKYPFIYKSSAYDGAPYLEIRPSKNPMKGSLVSVTENESHTEYTAFYLPGHYGTEHNDLDIKLKVFVKTKDHPETKALIAKLLEKIKMLFEEVGFQTFRQKDTVLKTINEDMTIQAIISGSMTQERCCLRWSEERTPDLDIFFQQPSFGIDKQVENIDNDIIRLDRALNDTLLDQMREVERTLQNEEKKLIREIKDLTISQTGVKECLHIYHDFCLMISELIEIFGLDRRQDVSAEMRQQYVQFLEYFPIRVVSDELKANIRELCIRGTQFETATTNLAMQRQQLTINTRTAPPQDVETLQLFSRVKTQISERVQNHPLRELASQNNPWTTRGSAAFIAQMNKELQEISNDPDLLSRESCKIM